MTENYGNHYFWASHQLKLLIDKDAKISFPRRNHQKQNLQDFQEENQPTDYQQASNQRSCVSQGGSSQRSYAPQRGSSPRIYVSPPPFSRSHEVQLFWQEIKDMSSSVDRSPKNDKHGVGSSVDGLCRTQSDIYKVRNSELLWQNKDKIFLSFSAEAAPNSLESSRKSSFNNSQGSDNSPFKEDEIEIGGNIFFEPENDVDRSNNVLLEHEQNHDSNKHFHQQYNIQEISSIPLSSSTIQNPLDYRGKSAITDEEPSEYRGAETAITIKEPSEYRRAAVTVQEPSEYRGAETAITIKEPSEDRRAAVTVQEPSEIRVLKSAITDKEPSEYRGVETTIPVKEPSEFRRTESGIPVKELSEYRRTESGITVKEPSEYRRAESGITVKEPSEYRRTESGNTVKEPSEYRRTESGITLKEPSEYRTLKESQSFEKFITVVEINSERAPREKSEYCNNISDPEIETSDLGSEWSSSCRTSERSERDAKSERNGRSERIELSCQLAADFCRLDSTYVKQINTNFVKAISVSLPSLHTTIPQTNRISRWPSVPTDINTLRKIPNNPSHSNRHPSIEKGLADNSKTFHQDDQEFGECWRKRPVQRCHNVYTKANVESLRSKQTLARSNLGKRSNLTQRSDEIVPSTEISRSSEILSVNEIWRSKDIVTESSDGSKKYPSSSDHVRLDESLRSSNISSPSEQRNLTAVSIPQITCSGSSESKTSSSSSGSNSSSSSTVSLTSSSTSSATSSSKSSLFVAQSLVEDYRTNFILKSREHPRSNDSLLAEYQALRSKLATLPDNLPNTTAKNTLASVLVTSTSGILVSPVKTRSAILLPPDPTTPCAFTVDPHNQKKRKHIRKVHCAIFLTCAGIASICALILYIGCMTPAMRNGIPS